MGPESSPPVRALPALSASATPLDVSLTVHEASSRLGLGPLLAPLVVPATLLLALGYGYADVYFPLDLPLASIVLLGAYTFAVVLVVTQVRQWGKVQSAGFMLVLGPVVGLFALYAAWAAFGAALLGKSARLDERVPGYLDLLLRPDLLWKLALAVNEQGWFTVRSLTPSGLFLWALWAIEAVVIVGGTTATVWVTVRDQVFCEECQAWCLEDLRRPFFDAPRDLAALQPAIDGGPGSVAALEALPRVSDETSRFLSVELHRCPRCKRFGTSILRLEVISWVRGKRSTRKTDLSPRFVVDPATYERLAALAKRP